MTKTAKGKVKKKAGAHTPACYKHKSYHESLSLKDIFIDESFDGRPIKPFFPNTKIEKAFLAINADNHASQSVAEKSGFTQRENVYEITKQGFLERMHNS